MACDAHRPDHVAATAAQRAAATEAQRATATEAQRVTATEAQRTVWRRGDFHRISRHNVTMAERLCDAVELRAGERVLDLACGSGAVALVAARRDAEVTGVDLVEELLERGRRRADAEGFVVEWLRGDAQELPFPDGRFDVVLSTYGVQFAPDAPRAAAEITRVARPGARIGLAGPVPYGWSGDWFATHAAHAPPPPGAASPLRWGTEAGVAELFDGLTTDLRHRTRTTPQYHRSLDAAVEEFATCFGPTLGALERLAAAEREPFLAQLRAVMAAHARDGETTAVVDNTYLESLAVVA